MRTGLFLSFCILFFSFTTSSQQLVINEVSQGISGAKEYVELLVVGTPTCNAIPCMDLRGYYIDDNNGMHASGSGVGIAAGCVRLKNIAFWSCIPYGTIILVYNDADPNASVPAQDLSMTDGNCKLIIPISDCTLLERHTTQPSTGTSVYPATGMTNCGSWSPISMANSDDSFQTITPAGGLAHSVSWGNNTLSTIIYFATAAGGNVAKMNNSVDNNPANQSNWTQVPVAGNETPGNANNAANAAWINSMNNSCSVILPFTNTVTSLNAGCICNGSATVAVSGAIAPYTYTWFPTGGNLSSAAALCSGIYTVSSTSSNGCVQSTTVNITATSGLTANINTTSITCNGLANGSATVFPLGGNGPYSFTWMPSGSNSPSVTNLSPGTYSVIVKDANNCSTTTTTSISQPSALSATIQSSPVSCNGGNNGSSTVSVSGGSPGYLYNWIPSGGTGSITSSAVSGSYSVLVTDVKGCTVTAQTTISQPPPLSSSITSSNANCGSANGSATVTISGGTPIYGYTWSPSGGNAPTASGLAGGSYTVSITDNNSCTHVATVSVNQPISMLTSITGSSVTCNGSANGSASVIVNGGSAPYNYTWSPSPGSGQGTGTVSSLTSQTYSVIITDISGCSTGTNITIIEPLPLNAGIFSQSVSCNNGANGSLTLAVSGGNPGYNYTWTPSGGTSSVITASAGNYTANVTDSKGCTLTVLTSIQAAPALSVTVSGTNVSCFFGNNGMASVTAAGGTPGYNYQWLPGAGNQAFVNNLTQGVYTVQVTDLNNCIAIATISVSQPSTALSAIASVTNITCNGASNGIASVNVSGGSVPYQYNWNPSAGGGSIATGLAPGNYTVVISDANNCTLSQSISISQPSPIVANVNALKLCPGQSGILNSTVTGGIAPYNYFWNNNPGTSTLSVNPSSNTTFSFHVSDANGCLSIIDTALVQSGAALAVNLIPSYTFCAGSLAQLSPTVTGGDGNYQYSWNPSGQTSQNIQVSLQNTSTFTVSVNDGCGTGNITATTTVYLESLDDATVLVNKYSGCAPACFSFTNPVLSNTSNVQSSMWLFSDGSQNSLINPTHCFSQPGTYSVVNVFSTKTGCSGSATLTTNIIIHPKPIAGFHLTEVSTNVFNSEFTFYNQSQNATHFHWDFGDHQTDSVFNPVHEFNEGNFLVTLVASNGFCQDTTFREVKIQPEFTFYAPNAFSPTGDGINEIFLPKGQGWKKETYSLLIFDRWGEEIFNTGNYEEGWNGYYREKPVKPDVYVWKVRLLDVFNKPHDFIGKVLILK